MPAPRWGRSEVVLGADLETPGVAHDAARMPKAQAGLTARIEAAQVLVIEGIEQVERDPHGRSRDVRKVLGQPQIDVAIGKGVREDEADPIRYKTTAFVAGPAEPQRAPDILAEPAAQRKETAEEKPRGIRNIHHPVRDDVGLLIVGRMLRDVQRV